MFYKLVLILFCVAEIQNVYVQPDASVQSFFVVPTTSPPADKVDEQRKIQQKLKETKHGLDFCKLQLKNAQLEKAVNESLRRYSDSTCPNKTYFENLVFKIESFYEKKLSEMERRYEKNVESISKTIVADIEKVFDVKIEKILSRLKNFPEKILTSSKKIDTGRKSLTALPEDCKQIRDRGFNEPLWTIQPIKSPQPFHVVCDMSTRGGGWTYVLNRFDGSQEFYLNWTDYKNGFGDLSGELWLGLEHLYEMTNSKDYQLLVRLTDWDNKTVYVQYNKFRIGNELKGYNLEVLEGFSGDTADYLVYHLNKTFLTPDRTGGNNKVIEYHGPWWYHNSFHVKLTGRYFEKATGAYGTGIHWGSFHGYSYSLKKAAMLIRPSP